ncbi:SHOCT domain-containing protein [Rhizobium leguminosarum]
MSHHDNGAMAPELQSIAERHNFSLDAVEHLFGALVATHGSQAQFCHPEFGGMGQWSRGGMLMIGDMFNHALKARVAVLCSDLAELAQRAADAQPLSAQHQAQYQGSGGQHLRVATAASNWWPKELGTPSATGAQNDMRYAFFPASRRLALSLAGQVTVYDTKDHLISGFSQQQSSDQRVAFSSQHGPIALSQLDKVSPTSEPIKKNRSAVPGEEKVSSSEKPDQPSSNQTRSFANLEEDIFDKIERLASLHAKGILTDKEFEAKKSELLSRL